MRIPVIPVCRSFPRPYVVLLLIAPSVLGLAIGLSGCRSKSNEDLEANDTAIPELDAETYTVASQNWPTIVRSVGSLQADENSTVGAKISGIVQAVHVELGDRVQAGDRLITLDQQQAKLLRMQAEAQLQQSRSAIGMAEDAGVDEVEPNNSAPVREAKAMWDESQASLKRAAQLVRQNAMAQSEYDQVAAAEQVAAARHQAAINGVREKIALVRLRQAELAVSEQRLDDTVVRSPFDGFVQQRNVAPGAYLSVGQSLAMIVRTDPLRFRGSVPERYAMSIKRGQEIRLHVASRDQPIIAKVNRTSPALDQRSRALVFEADVPNTDSGLQTGLFAEAEIVIAPDAVAVAIPESSVVEFAGTQKVWKVTDGIAGEQSVLLGPARDGFRRVVDGVQAGDVLLVDGRAGHVAKINAKPVDDSTSPAVRDKATIDGVDSDGGDATTPDSDDDPELDSRGAAAIRAGSS